jgi:hypothetical protein
LLLMSPGCSRMRRWPVRGQKCHCSTVGPHRRRSVDIDLQGRAGSQSRGIGDRNGVGQREPEHCPYRQYRYPCTVIDTVEELRTPCWR